MKYVILNTNRSDISNKIEVTNATLRDKIKR
jgi:hypothetical protein